MVVCLLPIQAFLCGEGRVCRGDPHDRVGAPVLSRPVQLPDVQAGGVRLFAADSVYKNESIVANYFLMQTM